MFILLRVLKMITNNTIKNQLKKTITPIIQRKILKVNDWKELRVDLSKLSTAEKLEILDAAQPIADEIVKKIFEKANRTKAVRPKTESIYQKYANV